MVVTVEIPTVLELTKYELVAGLVYISPTSNDWWSQQAQDLFIEHMKNITLEEAAQTIADCVTSYGENNIRSDEAPKEVMKAAKRAVERLWPEVRPEGLS